jgi:hypothetical protein
LWEEKEQKQKSKNNVPYVNIIPQYKPLIDKKLKLFVGREFVFEAFNEFREKKSNGYFTVIGEPGIDLELLYMYFTI